MQQLVPLLVVCLGTGALSAQTKDPGGVAPVWDVRVILQEMSAHAQRLLPVLERIDAKEWVSRGASETYVQQLESSKQQARALAQGATDLARQPERLPAALELYFRMHGLDAMISSLGEGIRKYQNPAVAEMLAGLAAEGDANRDRFQRFIIELASEREQQFAVMDREAQRCRGLLVRQPPPAAPSGRKK